jgi:hypothetical protein
MPTGQEFTKIPMADAISLPANQSVIIFDISTLSSTPPMPARSRPASCQPHADANAISSPPPIISARPNSTAALSPQRRPISPPGRAMARPGAR